MNDTAEEVAALSDAVDAGDGDEGSVSPTPVTVPKKRGRPSNSEKPKKAAVSIPGRGRGRPAKGSEGVNKKPAKTTASADGSEDEGTESDDGSPYYADSADGGTPVASKRGRKPKAKRKLPNPIEATGKGRGRPKKIAKIDDGEDEAADDDDDGVANDYKSGKKAATKGAKKGRGRPKKVNNSDDESSDDKEERRPLGRPPSGGIKLNIVRTGKGQGRPKKSVIAKRAAEAEKKAAKAENGGDEKVKKGGRPKTSVKVANLPTGKPRGRPKAVREDDSQNEDIDAEHNSTKADENSADNGDEDDQPNSD